MNISKYLAIPALLIATSLTFAAPPFSGSEDTAYADKLWTIMELNRLVGANRFQSMPYKTPPPHGHHVEVLEGKITVGDHEGLVIVKKNFGKTKEETKQQITNKPDEHMTSVTVMFKREEGYDADNQNWFWAKYAPDGSLLKNPKGMKLAGRVAKGKPKGCISCHKVAPGGDYIFIHDRYSKK